MHDGGIAVANCAPELLRLLQELLSEEGYEVATYLTDGTTQAQIRATRPRLVILDAGLYQSASGYALLKTLQIDPQTQRIPVLVTTVDHQFILDKAVFLQGLGYDVLELPASLADLSAKGAHLLARAGHA